jgi:hypothetical protein
MKLFMVGLAIAAGIMGLLGLICLGINKPETIDAEFEAADIDHRANMARQVH